MSHNLKTALWSMRFMLGAFAIFMTALLVFGAPVAITAIYGVLTALPLAFIAKKVMNNPELAREA